ncbi:hypothetical protein BDZ45DRAFT_748552 [Acephala macrosclerotiorum]|nr:hypothetical protein BDZ45DRAFT_748552 [Acephala macrosclerotiorum]
MLWYRKHYLLGENTWVEPKPKALVVRELDVLRSEGEAYAEKLKHAGVDVDHKIMKGMPRPFLAMDGVLQQGRDTITFMAEK